MSQVAGGGRLMVQMSILRMIMGGLGVMGIGSEFSELRRELGTDLV